MNAIEIPVEKVKIRSNVRKDYDKDALEELKKSIAQVGLIEPILVYQEDADFIVDAFEGEESYTKHLNQPFLILFFTLVIK